MYFHPYPYHQIPQVTNNLPYPALPASIPAMPSYPHEIGFVITAPSPGSSTTSLVTNLTEDHQKEPTEKKWKHVSCLKFYSHLNGCFVFDKKINKVFRFIMQKVLNMKLIYVD